MRKRMLASRAFCIVCGLVGALSLTDPAAAADRAYSGRGTAQFVSPTAFEGQGRATHLGNYREQGSVAFTPTSNPAVLHVEGVTVYTAANGDELHGALSGELNGATGEVDVTVTYTGGTGRFVNASGSSALVGQLSPSGAVSVSVSGSIDF